MGRDLCVGLTSPGPELSTQLPGPALYRVRVAGVTMAGRGNWSEAASGGGAEPSPLPRLSLALPYPPALLSLDVDSGQFVNTPLPSKPHLLAYLPWLSAHLTVDTAGRVSLLPGAGLGARLGENTASLALDPLGHWLYIAVGKAVLRMDLDSPAPAPQLLLSLNSSGLVGLDYHAGAGLLFMLTTRHTLLTTRLSPHGAASPPARPAPAGPACTCPASLAPDCLAVLPGGDTVQLVVRDAATGGVHITDQDLCNCRSVLVCQLLTIY